MVGLGGPIPKTVQTRLANSSFWACSLVSDSSSSQCLCRRMRPAEAAVTGKRSEWVLALGRSPREVQRNKASDLLKVVDDLCGLHATSTLTPYLSLLSRMKKFDP